MFVSTKNLFRLLFSGLLTALVSVAGADVKLPAILGSNMVLQRSEACPVWGWADAGETVTVSFAGQKVTTRADAEGKWSVSLRPMSASAEGRALTVTGGNTITLENVLVGEVWLCSGQSNMEWTVSRSNNPKEEIANANHPTIRHIKFPHRPADKPMDDIKSDGWKVCAPESVGGFTAAGYFFARELTNELKVPVGLIGSNWGGTRIEPWTPPVGFKQVPALSGISDNLDDFPHKNDKGQINHQTPLALYNGMISPILPYTIRGAIWYQGESNNGEGMLYFEKMKALIGGWRALWKNPEMPFYFVQLAPYNYGGNRTQQLPGIWEAQLKSLAIPHTGMAVTTDIGNVKDIHPRNKQEVGRRLALWALAKDYGKKGLVFSGPLYKSHEIRGSKIIIEFDHAEGLKSNDGKDLTYFTIAGADKKFVPAQAEVSGSRLIVSSDEVRDPKAVRFGWDQSAEPNFINGAGLPASPFRTDSW